MDERRKSKRINVSFPVECEALSSRNYFYTVSKDLSLVGIKIVSGDFLPRGNFLQLHINLIDKLLSVKAKVVWCNNERVSDRYAAGLEFIETNETTKNRLSGFINKVYNS